MITYETNYLAHHGVKGMKWGRRKQKVSMEKKRRSTQRVKTHSRSNISDLSLNKRLAIVGIGATGGAVTYAALKQLGVETITSLLVADFVAVGSGIVSSKLMLNKK